MHQAHAGPLAGRHVVFLSWRDTANPEGGGAERYLEKMAAGLVERGCRVTIFCAAHAAARARGGRRRHPLRAPRRASSASTRGAMRALRRGDLAAARAAGRRRRRAERAAVLLPPGHPAPGRRPGAPRAPRAVAGRLPRPDRAGRLVDRAPARAAGSTAASSTSRSPAPPATSWATLGVDPARGRGGAQRHRPLRARRPGQEPGTPMVAVVGRLVPHKQVEHAIDAVLALRGRFPGLRLHVVGIGLVGGRAARLRRGARRRRQRRVRGPRRRGAQARGLRAGLGAGAALAEGGLGPGDRRGRHAHHPHRGLPLRGRDPGVGRRRRPRASWSTTRRRSPPRWVACWTTRTCAQQLGRGALEKSHRFTWSHAQQSFADVLVEVLSGRRVAGSD